MADSQWNKRSPETDGDGTKEVRRRTADGTKMIREQEVSMSITSFSFGQLADGTEVTAYRIENSVGTSVTLIDYGATVQSLKVPDCTGKLTDVVFGYDTAAEYEANDGFRRRAVFPERDHLPPRGQ